MAGVLYCETKFTMRTELSIIGGQGGQVGGGRYRGLVVWVGSVGGVGGGTIKERYLLFKGTV